MEKVTFLTCREATTKDHANHLRVAGATFKRLDVSGHETSSNEGASMTEACVIGVDKECEAYFS